MRMQIGAICLALLLTGCSKSTNTAETTVSKMGEKVHAGSLVYGVYEAQWLPQLADGLKVRIPENRFLALKVTITNSGSKPSVVPGFVLEDSKGESYPELTDGAGLKEWLPVFRKLDPVETKEGNILFDVPSGAYYLVVKEETDFSKDPSHERIAKIEIPPSVSSPAPDAVK